MWNLFLAKIIILLVEDNEGILFNLSLLLKMNDYTVITALNGENALEVLENTKTRPDLIISDIIMPKMDGYEFLKEISHNPNWSMIPFIFLSAKASPDEIRFGKLLGADDYLTKPIDEELLLSLIRNKIEKVNMIKNEIENAINIKIQENITNIFKFKDNSLSDKLIILYIIEFNPLKEPKILHTISNEENIDNTIDDDLIIEMFKQCYSFFNQISSITPESMLFTIDPLELNALVAISELSNEINVHESQRNTIMIGILATSISYFQQLHLKNTVDAIFYDVKLDQSINETYYLTEINTVLGYE